MYFERYICHTMGCSCLSAFFSSDLLALEEMFSFQLLLPYFLLSYCFHLFSIFLKTAAAAAKSLQLCLTLCNPIDSSPPGSPVPGILQARILEWVAISFSNACMHAKSLQSCPTLCDPMDSSPPGSSVHRILQQEYWSGLSFPSPCYCIIQYYPYDMYNM